MITRLRQEKGIDGDLHQIGSIAFARLVRTVGAAFDGESVMAEPIEERSLPFFLLFVADLALVEGAIDRKTPLLAICASFRRSSGASKTDFTQGAQRTQVSKVGSISRRRTAMGSPHSTQ